MKNWFLPVLGFIVGSGLFAVMIYVIGPARCLETLREVGGTCVFSFILLILSQVLFFTLGWQALLQGAGFRPPLHWTGISQMMGYAGNNITPSMYLGGEPVAAFFLAKHQNLPAREVMGTMITSKFIQFFAFLILFFTGSYLVFTRPGFIDGLPENLEWIVGVMKWANVVVGTGTILLLTLIISGKNALTALTRFFARFGIGSYALMRLKPKIRGMETTIHQAFQTSWRHTLLCFVFSFLAMLTIFARPLLFFEFVSTDSTAFSMSALTLALVQASVFFTLTQIVQAFQFTPGGLGIFDAASVVIFLHVFGISEKYGMAFNLVLRLSDVVIVGAGAYLIAHFGAAVFLRKKTDLAEA